MKTRFEFGLFSFHGVINLRSYSLSTCEHIIKYKLGSRKTTNPLAVAKHSCIISEYPRCFIIFVPRPCARKPSSQTQLLRSFDERTRNVRDSI